MARVWVCVATILAFLAATPAANGQSGGWDTAHVTFYGDMSGAETMQGACGYGDLFNQGYGIQTAALSTALFNDGLACGGCYELRCYDDPQWCIPGASTIITATNFCPANWSIPSDNGGWCNPPRKHFDLSMPAFLKIVQHTEAGIAPVQFRRVPCVKKGGIKFEMKEANGWKYVLVFNVGGSGDVKAVAVKGTKTGWMDMTRSWGQNWHTDAQLQGQGLSFRVTTGDGRTVQSDNVAPASWTSGQVFEGKQF